MLLQEHHLIAHYWSVMMYLMKLSKPPILYIIDLRELRRHLKASSDQRQYLLNLISIFHEIDDPILSEIADSMKSEL